VSWAGCFGEGAGPIWIEANADARRIVSGEEVN